MGEQTISTTAHINVPLAPERECSKPDTYFDGTRWRCRSCTWTSPLEEADR